MVYGFFHMVQEKQFLPSNFPSSCGLVGFFGLSIREFDLSNRQERGIYKLLGGVDRRLFVEEGGSSQSR